jgi:hypothetical protein
LSTDPSDLEPANASNSWAIADLPAHPFSALLSFRETIETVASKWVLLNRSDRGGENAHSPIIGCRHGVTAGGLLKAQQA